MQISVNCRVHQYNTATERGIEKYFILGVVTDRICMVWGSGRAILNYIKLFISSTQMGQKRTLLNPKREYSHSLPAKTNYVVFILTQ